MQPDHLMKATPKGHAKNPESLSKQAQTMDRVTLLAIVAIFCTTLTLVETLPNDVLDRNPAIDRVVSFMSDYIPGVQRFRTISVHPQIFATVYTFALLAWPLMTVFVFLKPLTRCVRLISKNNTYSKQKLFALIPGSIVVVVMTLWFVPSESVRTLHHTRILWEMNTGKFTFSMGIMLFISGISIFSSLAIAGIIEMARNSFPRKIF